VSADAYAALVGKRVKRAVLVGGPNEDADGRYVVLEFDDGTTLYADAPTLHDHAEAAR
jgi:hypothetical protein